MTKFFCTTLFKHEIKTRLKSLFIWSVIVYMLFTICVIVMSSFLDSKLPDLFSGIFTSLPKEIAGGFHMAQAPDMTNYALNFGSCLQILMIISCIYASYLGISLAYDASHYKYYYSFPVSRTALIFTGVVLRFLNLLAFNLIFLLAISSTLQYYGHIELFYEVTMTFLMYFGAELLLLGIGILISVFIGINSSAASITTAKFLIMLIFWFVGTLVPYVGRLRILSPCTYFNVPSILCGNEKIAFKAPIIMAILGLLCIFSATVVFQRRKELVMY